MTNMGWHIAINDTIVANSQTLLYISVVPFNFYLLRFYLKFKVERELATIREFNMLKRTK